jgi:hypothetical protein
VRPTRLLLIAVVMLVLAGPGARVVPADTVELLDGYTFRCLIHDATRRFPDKPIEDWLEFEIGSWTLSIPRTIVRSAKKDNEYQPPENAEETRRIVKEILDRSGDPTSTATRPTPTPVPERTQNLVAKVVYLVNFADATLGGSGSAISVEEGDDLPPDTEIRVKKNSRAEVEVGARIRIGIRAGSRARFDKMEVDRREGGTVWTLNLDVPEGKVWIDISGLEAGERILLRVVGTIFEVTSDSLFSISTSLGLDYEFAYWKGPSELRVTVPAREAGGFNIRPEYLVSFGPTGSSDLEEERLDMSGLEEWENWRQFDPVEVELEPRPIPPPLETEDSMDIQYSLREAAGVQSLDVRPEIKSSVLQDLRTYRTALGDFREDVGRYPTVEEGLDALRTNPGIADWDGPYVDENIQELDPWGEPYRYRILGTGEGSRPAVYSSGRNGVDEFGLGSDIW